MTCPRIGRCLAPAAKPVGQGRATAEEAQGVSPPEPHRLLRAWAHDSSPRPRWPEPGQRCPVPGHETVIDHGPHSLPPRRGAHGEQRRPRHHWRSLIQACRTRGPPVRRVSARAARGAPGHRRRQPADRRRPPPGSPRRRPRRLPHRAPHESPPRRHPARRRSTHETEAQPPLSATASPASRQRHGCRSQVVLPAVHHRLLAVPAARDPPHLLPSLPDAQDLRPWFRTGTAPGRAVA